MKNILKSVLILINFLILNSAYAQISFDKSDINTGLYHSDIKINDFNNDGKLDLLLNNSYQNNSDEIHFSILTNSGNGMFSSKIDYLDNSFGFALNIDCGDLNGDGKVDLAISDYFLKNLSVITNTGNGTFGAKRTIISNGNYGGEIKINDLNNDGQLDILASIGQSYVLTNTGSAIFTLISQNFNFGYITLGDFNNDNKPDLVTTSEVLTNTGFGTFSSSGIFKNQFSTNGIGNVSAILTADLNGDNNLDIIIVNRDINSTLTSFINDGNGNFVAKPYLHGGYLDGIEVGDVNNDKKLDLICYATNSSTFSILINTGNGSFDSPISFNYGNIIRKLKLADLNGDNKIDVILANENGGLIALFNTTPNITQTITGFSLSKTAIYGSSPITVNAAASSGLDIKYSSSDVNIVSIAGNSLFFKNAGIVTITASQIGNSTFIGTSLTSDLTVLPANLTVTALNASKNYGTSNPLFNSSIVGLLNGDNININYSSSATFLNSVGNYSIIPNVSGAALANYSLTTVAGTLNITPSSLAVGVVSTSKVYGSANPTFTYTTTGLVNGDMVSVAYITSATSVSGVGFYSVIPSVTGAALANYSLTTFSGVLSVTPSNLIVSSFNATKIYGQPNPLFTGTVSGFANSNDAFNINSFFYSSTNDQIPAGTYPIFGSVTGTALVNYNAIYNNGSLVINQSTQSIVGLQNLNNTYSLPVGSIISVSNITATSGLPVSLSSSNPMVLSVTGFGLLINGIGASIITASQNGNGNYLASSSQNYIITVLQVGSTVTGTNTSTSGSNVATVSGLQVSNVLSNTANPIKVTVSGTNITSGATATVGGVALTNVSFIGTNALIGTIPAGATVTNPSSPSVVVQNAGTVASTSTSVTPTVTDVLDGISETLFIIYPNPNTGSFTVSLKSAQSYQIYSLEGALLQTGSLNEGENNIITSLKTGFYLIKVGNGVKKLLVE